MVRCKFYIELKHKFHAALLRIGIEIREKFNKIKKHTDAQPNFHNRPNFRQE